MPVSPRLLVLLLCLVSGLAQATYDFGNLRAAPDPEGGPGLVARVTDYCHLSPWNIDGTTVARSGQIVTITLPSVPLTICLGTPPPPADIDIPIGILPPGDYQLILQEAPAPPATAAIPLLNTAFSVAGAGPFSDLRVVPAPALAFAPISARLLHTCGLGYANGPAQTSIVEGRITLRIPVSLDSCFAGLPPPPTDRDFPLGSVAPGVYTVVVLQEVNPGSVVIPALSTTITVQAGSAQSVPAQSGWMLILLMSLLGLIGVQALRRQSIT